MVDILGQSAGINRLAVRGVQHGVTGWHNNGMHRTRIPLRSTRAGDA